MTGWRREKLKDVVGEWIKGQTPLRSRGEYYADKPEIPWVRVGDLKERILTETEEYLTFQGAKAAGRWVPKNAVLLSVSGTIGKTAIAGVKLKVNQAVQAMYFKEEILPEYAYYYFQFYTSWLISQSNQVTIPNLTTGRLMEAYILFPSREEQAVIVERLERAEDLGKNREALWDSIYQAFYGALGPRFHDLGRWENTVRLKNYLAEAGAEPIGKGDLLIARNKAEAGFRCQLAREEQEGEAAGNSYIRIRVQNDRLYPEFLWAWLCFVEQYGGYDFFMGGTALSRKILENVPVPQIGQEEQEQYVRIVRPLLRIVHRQTEWEESYWSFYRSMLAWAFLGHLSADYRRLHHIEGPDFALLLQHYYVKPETLKLAGVRAADWERSIQEEKRQLLEHLSAFQRAILEGFVESEAPMPVHIIHKQLKSERNPIYKGYSIQDALATVKLLEELGFLEKTLPERLYRNGEELQDFAGKPITIQNYQACVEDREE
ncbi:hypothetical protein D5278_07340 [bacterium 1XD21-13]|nr:hypothetical protein [bacterium 1XD21-13]